MRRAFTLLELIIVIAIMVILAAILLPAFHRPREGGARRSSCQTLLKQIGLGLLQYTQDYDGKFPPARVTSSQGWVNVTQPYINSTEIWQCPSGPHHSKSSTDYFYNRHFSRLNSEKVSKPVQTLLAGDGADDAPYWNSITQLPAAWITEYPAPSVRHMDSANYLFADGHVKWKPFSKIKANLPVERGEVTFAIR